MDQLDAGRRFLLVLLGAVAALTAALLGVALVLGFEIAASEDGPLELLQEITLFAAALLFLAAACSFRRGPRMAAIDAAVICVVFFFREFEIEAAGPLASYLDSKLFRWHELMVVLALLAPYAALRLSLVLDLVIYVLTLRAWPFILALLLLVLSWVFDKFGVRYLQLPTSMFAEELAESAAYMVMAMTALHFLRRTRAPASSA